MKNIFGMILTILGVLVIGAGIIGGCYLSFYTLLFKGIMNVYDSVTSIHSASLCAIGVVKIIFCEIGFFINAITLPIGSILITTGDEIKE